MAALVQNFSGGRGDNIADAVAGIHMCPMLRARNKHAGCFRIDEADTVVAGNDWLTDSRRISEPDAELA